MIKSPVGLFISGLLLFVPLLCAAFPGEALVSYAGGNLTINAQDATLAEVLTQIATLTKVKIEIPPTLNGERLSWVKLGPGSPREILAALLRNSHLDYVIQASDSDPGQLQGVILMAAGGNVETDTSASLAESNRSQLESELQQTLSTAAASVPSPPDNVTAPGDGANASAPSMAGYQPTLPASGQQNQLNQPRTGTLSPPEVLSPQSINQQLQSMYQQRMQILQQDRSSSLPTGSGSHP